MAEKETDFSHIDTYPDPTLEQGVAAAKWLYANYTDGSVALSHKLKAAGTSLSFARSMAFPHDEGFTAPAVPEEFTALNVLSPGGLITAPAGLGWLAIFAIILKIIEALTK